MLKIKYAQVVHPLFIAGTNLGDKLDITKRTGLEMAFDQASQLLYVKLKTETAIVKDWSAIIPGTTEAPKPAEPPKIQKVIDAQVDSPTSHVFAGEGKGHTGVPKVRTKQ